MTGPDPSADPPADPSKDLPADPSSRISPPRSVPPVSAEQLVGAEPVAAEPVEERRYPSTIGGAFYLVVLAFVAAGLAVVVFGDWRAGIRWMGAGLVLGAVTRLVLPSRDAGMLAVRNKFLDASLLAGLAAALVFLSGSIPDQPGL